MKDLFKKAIMTSEEIDECIQSSRERDKNLNKDIGMTRMERAELIERVKAMSPEEMELVVEQIPIDICMNRITKEIERAKQFEATIMNAVEMVKE